MEVLLRELLGTLQVKVTGKGPKAGPGVGCPGLGSLSGVLSTEV